MALKDWKKTKNQNPDLGEILTWKNEKEDGVLWIQNTGKAFYVNVVYHTQGMYKNGENKRFDSKSQAISFAKKYMRLH